MVVFGSQGISVDSDGMFGVRHGAGAHEHHKRNRRTACVLVRRVHGHTVAPSFAVVVWFGPAWQHEAIQVAFVAVVMAGRPAFHLVRHRAAGIFIDGDGNPVSHVEHGGVRLIT